jgi:hypothetical protein
MAGQYRFTEVPGSYHARDFRPTNWDRARGGLRSRSKTFKPTETAALYFVKANNLGRSRW